MTGRGVDEAIRLEDGDVFELWIRRKSGDIPVFIVRHMDIDDNGARVPVEPFIMRIRLDAEKDGRFVTDEMIRRAAIEEEREACARIADQSNSAIPEDDYQASSRKATAAGIAAKIRARANSI